MGGSPAYGWGEGCYRDGRATSRLSQRPGRRAGHAWSRREQAGVDGAGEDTRSALAQRNRDYEKRFGYVFLICATGKTAEEMLDALRGRLTHDPATELRIAAKEQANITRLRLDSLVAP